MADNSESDDESLLVGGKKFLDIFVGNKSIIPLKETFETEYFGPIEFTLNIENEEKSILSETIPFNSLLEEGNGVFWQNK